VNKTTEYDQFDLITQKPLYVSVLRNHHQKVLNTEGVLYTYKGQLFTNATPIELINYIYNYNNNCNIIFQHPVALVKHLIHRGSIGDATSCHVCTPVVCYIVLYYRCFFYNIIQHYKVITTKINYVDVALYCF
jgi:hypothetical protein